MSLDFSGSVVVVTGGAGGIGSGLVQALIERGAQVAALDVKENTDATVFVKCDVTDPASVAAAVARVRKELGDADRLVCAAGIVKEVPFEALGPEQWHQIVDISLTGSYLICHALIPGMLRRGGGAIVTMSSGWGRKGYPRGADYAAAKSGVEALTKSLAIEFASRGVRANSVAPGPIRTAMIWDNPEFDESARTAAIPMGRLGEVADIVDPVMFLLGDASRYITGQVLHVNGGLLMP